jgi:DNA invertase Pin-like site-specific DNA recombinase
MSSAKIQSTHQERTAYVYVRQSTPHQVIEHRESTERQYHLRERAIGLGWAPGRVEIIDEDQGRSGSSAVHRIGFQRLVSEVGMGKVGLVLMLEASRLARNNSDWYRLIEICGVTGTLIGDETAVYNPRDPNDRLLLGVKGTISEAELFTLRTRLYEGRWNKARKGLLQFPLPIGYVRCGDGSWELDPNAQVRERLQYVFELFRRHGVARVVVRDLRQQGLDLPTLDVGREGYGSLLWKAATLSTVVRILHNPAYAGAYVFGRWDYSGTRRSSKSGKVLPHLLSMTQWPVNLLNHHATYLEWGEFVKNQERLRQNWNRGGGRGVEREGNALLQGIAFCGICGQKMGVQHHTLTERRSSSYICQKGYQYGETRVCQSMTSRPVDSAVTTAFLEAASPMSLQVAMQVMGQIEQDLAGKQRQQHTQLEQARYEARLAQRQYDAVDPANRLVAAELERRWNEKLERAGELEKAYARAEQEVQWQLSPEERAAITRLSRDLPAIWNAETTTTQDRKRLLRMAIESVQLDGVSTPGQIELQIHWRPGVITVHTAKRPAQGEWSLKTPAEAVARIHSLAGKSSYIEIAEQLNREGFRTAFGRPFTHQTICYICRRDGVAPGRRQSGSATKLLSDGSDHGNFKQKVKL